MTAKRYFRVDPEKVKDAQTLADELKELDEVEKTSLLLAIQLSKLRDSIKKEQKEAG